MPLGGLSDGKLGLRGEGVDLGLDLLVWTGRGRKGGSAQERRGGRGRQSGDERAKMVSGDLRMYLMRPQTALTDFQRGLATSLRSEAETTASKALSATRGTNLVAPKLCRYDEEASARMQGVRLRSPKRTT